MSKTLDNVALVDLIPPDLKGDPDVIALGTAVDSVFFSNVPKIRNCYTTADIDHASSEVVDLIATERNSDFYERSLPIDNRRALAKHAYLFKRLKGTPYAVRKILLDILSLYPDEGVYDWSNNIFVIGVTPIGAGQFYSPLDQMTVEADSTPVVFEYAVNAFVMGITPIGDDLFYSDEEMPYFEVYVNYFLPYSHQSIENAVKAVKRLSQWAIIYHSGPDTSLLSEPTNAVVIIN